MKHAMILFAFLLGLSACVPAAAPADPASSETPVSTPTQTVEPSKTPIPPPTETPTPTAPEYTPTPRLPDIFHLPESLNMFPAGQEAQIPDYIAYLRMQDSLLTPGSSAPWVPPTVTNSSGAAHVTVSCNSDGAINCAPVAAFLYNTEVNGQPIDPHIIILEIRNRDGTRGYLGKYVYDSREQTVQREYQYIVDNPMGPLEYYITMGLPNVSQPRYTYAMSLLTPGLKDFINQWSSTGNIPIIKGADGRETIMILP